LKYAIASQTTPLLLLGGFAALMLKFVLRFWTPRFRANPRPLDCGLHHRLAVG
jgi:hypothetical protein